MLPQMMPLPWIFVFIMIFFCYFSISLLLNFFFISVDNVELVKSKTVGKFFSKMPW